MNKSRPKLLTPEDFCSSRSRSSSALSQPEIYDAPILVQNDLGKGMHSCLRMPQDFLHSESLSIDELPYDYDICYQRNQTSVLDNSDNSSNLFKAIGSNVCARDVTIDCELHDIFSNANKSIEINREVLLTPDSFQISCDSSLNTIDHEYGSSNHSRPTLGNDCQSFYCIEESNRHGMVQYDYSNFNHFNGDISDEETGRTDLSVRRKLPFERKSQSSATEDENGGDSNFVNVNKTIYEDASAGIERHSTSKDDLESNELRPIGVFWDIENCRIPKGMSAIQVVQAIRNRFFVGHREAEFVCVCDTLKENAKMLEELNDAQVNILHVGSIVKNAADDKLLQGMRRFADLYGAGSVIILISGDSNFATELYDLHYRKDLRIILIHNAHAQESLKLSAHETVLFSEITQQIIPKAVNAKPNYLCREITVWNLPMYIDTHLLRKRLHCLASNCGGKNIYVKNGMGRICFTTAELAGRAKKRIEGEDVYGNKVFCTFGKPGEFPSHRNFRHQASYQSNYRAQFSFRESYNSDDNHVCDSEHDNGGDWLNEQVRMDVSTGIWDKSYHSSSNSNNNFYKTQNTYCPQVPSPPVRKVMNAWCPRVPSPVGKVINDGRAGGSSNSSPVLHSSSQGSSREGTPTKPVLLRRAQDSHNSAHCIPNSIVKPEPRSSDTRMPRISQPFLGSCAKGPWISSLTPMDMNGHLVNHFRSLSVTDACEDNISSCQSSVELLISNLDQHIDAREMKKILLTSFRERVMVLHVSVFVQSDGSLGATVTVPTQQDAQYAISQLHRKRIGSKRIIISYVTRVQQPPELKRSKVITLLKEVPGRKLPLFKFREFYERRYQETIGVSEMYNMRDIITVSDNSTGRMVCLHSEYKNCSSGTRQSDNSLQNPDELRFCKIHSKGPDRSVGWMERDHSATLPYVNLTLNEVSCAIGVLLQSHNGVISLSSLVDCYEAEVGPLQEDVNGVPLEHLVSCVSEVVIITGVNGFKYLHKQEVRPQDESEELGVSPPLMGNLALFSRELVDLLKTFPHCQMSFTKFIPSYHHHFGRQCRVADYGYTKLADLLVSLPQLIQIIGEGSKRIITLAHKAQIKRFSSDLLRVLKSQPSKIISLEVFPEAYHKVMNKVWNPTDYGVCHIMDLLKEVQETTVILKKEGDSTTIAIPKREQTAEEIERTRLFATEVIELLRHSPKCQMQFNRFIPAYHHHFGRQCRVSDYGFTKLMELLEAIPDVLQILGEDDDGEKVLQLVEKESLKVLGDQLYMLVKNSPKSMISLSSLSTVFTHYFGYSLKPNAYNCQSLPDLIAKLHSFVKLNNDSEEARVALVDRTYINDIWVKSRKLLWDVASCTLSIKEFLDVYFDRFKELPKMKILRQDLEEYVQVADDESGHIRLVPVQVFARDLIILLNEAGGRMLLVNFETAYLARFGVACRPAMLGFPNLVALLQVLSAFVTIKGRGTKRILVLNRDFGSEIPSYCPPIPRPAVKAVTKESWSPSAARASQPVSHCSTKHFHSESGNPPVMMTVTPSSGQPAFSSASPLIYPGSSAAAPTGSMVWGQVWPSQYPVLPPLSPATAHYMMPTFSFNWGNSAASPTVSQPTKAPGDRGNGTVAIHTLRKVTPPNPSELPPPELLKNNLAPVGLFPHKEAMVNGSHSTEATVMDDNSPSKHTIHKSSSKRLAAHFSGSNPAGSI